MAEHGRGRLFEFRHRLFQGGKSRRKRIPHHTDHERASKHDVVLSRRPIVDAFPTRETLFDWDEDQLLRHRMFDQRPFSWKP